MSNQPLRVLCLDIEGGYGGSSRSLYESVRHLDRQAVSAEVWCRMAGPIQARYRAAGIPCRVTPDMPVFSALPRVSRNVVAFSRFLFDFWCQVEFHAELLRTARDRFDVIHFNHEALFMLADWLRRRTVLPSTMHIRTMCWDYGHCFARYQAGVVSRAVRHLVFITENEQAGFARAGGRREGTIIYNIAEPYGEHVHPHEAVPRDGCLKIACISNYAWVRGTDRLIEVAEALAALGRRDFLFIVAGHMALPRSLSGMLGRIGQRGGTLADYASERGVSDMFLFLGHVADPERVLAACDVLIKPTRENNPWGRDILEALACGKPVLTIGSYDQFVKNGETGILQRTFAPQALAQSLLKLADNRQLVAEMGHNAQQRIARLCNGSTRAADLVEVWTKLVRA